MNTAPEPVTRWLTSQQAAERLGVTRKTVLNYMHSGKLPAYRLNIGNQYRLDQADVDAFVVPIPAEEVGGATHVHQK